MADPLDRRLHAYRDDLADAALEGRINTARFVEPTIYHVTAPVAPVHADAERGIDLTTQALFGEAVRVFEVVDGWAWGQLEGDGYVGYIPANLLSVGQPPGATHKVCVTTAIAYREPTARAPELRAMLFGTTCAVTGGTAEFAELATGGFISRRAIEPVDAITADYVETATKFIGTPYLWGGKSVRGIDCSGLVQLSLQRAGIGCPRDTDMQQRDLAGDIDTSGEVLDRLQKGDVVYWPGHVGIMIDKANIMHASGSRNFAEIEAVADVAERSRGGGPAVAAVKRLQLLES